MMKAESHKGIAARAKECNTSNVGKDLSIPWTHGKTCKNDDNVDAANVLCMT